MPNVYEIKYLATGNSKEFYCADGVFYKVGENAFIRLSADIAWCNECNDFVDAEWIRPLEEVELELNRSIEKDRNRILNFDRMPPERFTEKKKRMRDYYKKSLVAAERTIEWRRNRVSPPRCLTCGSTSIFAPEEDEPILIDGVGEVIVEFAPIFADVEYSMKVYSPEGEFLWIGESE